MKTIRLLTVAIVLITIAPAHAGKHPSGRASISTGPSQAKGVETQATSYQPPLGRNSSDSARASSATLSADNMTSQFPISNRCVGLVSGDSFSAFSNSSTCDSFAAPAIGSAPPAPPAGPANSPREIASILADRAMALAADPALHISPSAIGLTGLDSYFWLAREPRPIVATADVPGVAVTAEARPVRYSWDFGDGATRSTTHIGRRWTRRRAGTISHLYETSDTYTVRTTVVWVARWRLGAGPWQPLGYFTTTDSVEYPVRQIVALLVRPR